VDDSEARLAARTASESINLEIPLNIKLIPTKVPITQTELDGHCAQIRIPRTSVTIPSNRTHEHEQTMCFAAQQTHLFEIDKKQSHEMALDKTGLHPLQQAAGLASPQL